MENNLKAQKAQEEASKSVKDSKKSKKIRFDGNDAENLKGKNNSIDEDDGEMKTDAQLANDPGHGVFPVTDSKEERFVELPNIMDQEEMDQILEKKRKQEDRLGLRIDPDYIKIETDASGLNILVLHHETYFICE